MGKPKVLVACPTPTLDGVEVVDWSLCCICQKGTGTLSCPAKNPVASLKNAAYATVGTNLQELVQYNFKLESGLPVAALQENKNTITESLTNRQAKWHSQCKSKFLPPKFSAVLQEAKTSHTQPDVVSNAQTGDAVPGTSRMSTRSTLPLVKAKSEVCFLCKEPASLRHRLHLCATDHLYMKVKKCATTLNDTELLAMLSEGDLVAIEAKYHKHCLTRLYNKCEVHVCVSTEDREKVICEGIAFTNLILYMQKKLTLNSSLIFKMGDLVSTYRDRLAQLLGLQGIDSSPIHTTRLREKILSSFPNLTAQKSGREYIIFREGTYIHRELHKEDQDSDALAAHYFLKKVRKTIKESTIAFSGSFNAHSEEASIPASLLAVINTLLYGSPVHDQCRATRPALTICQLIMLNFREKTPKGNFVRNKREREPPLPVYLSLSTYGKSRDKARIKEMHGLGMSVSYDRVCEVTSQLCRKVTQDATKRGVLCPSQLKHGIPLVAAVDNIDVNPSSTTSCGSGFHGTGISLFQLRSGPNEGTPQQDCTAFEDVECRGERSVPDLPEFYSEIKSCTLPLDKPPCPRIPTDSGMHMLSTDSNDLTWQMESPWLSSAHDSLAGLSKDEHMELSWSAYHASTEGSGHTPALNALLPLFSEKSEDPATIKHVMKLVKKVTAYLNGDQPPVLCGDQPIFAVIKSIQWNWPDEFGEHLFVSLMGPLHIEKVILRVLGQLIVSSGWVEVVGDSEVTSAGSAEGLLKVSHIMKARAIHQKTAVALFSLLRDAYDEDNPDQDLSIEDWAEQKAQEFPLFKFWLTVLNLEILLLTFVRSVRMGDFELYKRSIRKVIPFLFSFNHPHYSRWLTVHLRDMEALPTECPQIFKLFSEGNFVVRKTGRPFSALGVDHAYEQNNASVKATGGIVGLTEDFSSLRRWTVGGPEVMRLLTEFGHMYDDEDDEEDDDGVHHEQTPGFQRRFSKHCSALKESFLKFENPFAGNTQNLIALDSRCVASPEAVANLYSLEERGLQAFNEFVTTRLMDKKVSIYDKISQIKCHIFTLPSKKTQCPVIASLKEDNRLFNRLFVVSQARQFDMAEFFRHENQLFPPSLSLNGKIRTGTKSYLLPILENLAPKNTVFSGETDGVLFDGAALVHQKSPKLVQSIAEYCEKQLAPYVLSVANTYKAKSVAIAWDLYNENSIKAVRETRGEGIRQVDLPRKGMFPRNWNKYLKNLDNKMELFSYLAERLVSLFQNPSLVTNIGDKFASSSHLGTALPGESCAHLEEADGRLMLHVADMAEHGAKSVLVCCSDTDVLVLGISFFQSLQQKGLKELWFRFGVGSKQRFIPAHLISEKLGTSKAEALRGYHSFTGCDSVSFFASVGKPKSYGTWEKETSDELTNAFLALSRPLEQLDTEVVDTLQRYVINLYRGDPTCDDIDQAREYLFSSGERALGEIPPSKAALIEHTKRAAYQGGHIWGTCDRVDVVPPPIDSWGWTTVNGTVQPFWSPLPDIWKCCRELDRCGCASDCSTQRCLCRRYRFPCCKACKKCKGNCSNKSPTLSTILEEPEEE